MDFLTEELKKIINPICATATYTGRAAYISLDKRMKAKIQFGTTGSSNKYGAVNLSVFSTQCGFIDAAQIRFVELWGKKRPNEPGFGSEDNIAPHIWESSNNDENTGWYGYVPGRTEYAQLVDEIRKYIRVFAIVPGAPDPMNTLTAKELLCPFLKTNNPNNDCANCPNGGTRHLNPETKFCTARE